MHFEANRSNLKNIVPPLGARQKQAFCRGAKYYTSRSQTFKKSFPQQTRQKRSLPQQTRQNVFTVRDPPEDVFTVTDPPGL